MTSYLVFMATLAGIYALLSLGLVTIWGQGGMVSLGLVGFYAVGAYTSALLSSAGVPIGISLACAALMAGAVGVVLSYLTRPLRGDYLAIVSLGFAVLVARLEDTLGVDPFTAAEEAVFPVTLGDFVKVYENGVH